MKKMALLMTLVLVFSLSGVFATEENVTLLMAPEVVSGEIISNDDVTELVEISGEDTLVSDTEEVLSGELTDETVSEDLENNEVVTEEEETTSSSNSAMVGAILAIGIVIGVVAVAAILRKD